MIVQAFASSDVGRVRARNEDNFVVRTDLGVYAVADGMGGHAAGDVASKTALDSLVNSFTIANDPTLVAQAIQLANLAVWERGHAETDKAGMGTTLTVLAVAEDATSASIGHVGDSRCYLLRGGTFAQLTTDHSIAPRSNVLTRALGTHNSVDVDTASFPLLAGDLFLLCSDGLTNMVRDNDLHAMVQQKKPLQEIVQNLIEAANLRGGVDNITALLVKAEA